MRSLAPLLAAALAAAPAAEEDVRAADSAMSGTSERRDLDAFASWVAEDALFAGGAGVAAGRPAVRERWAPLFAQGGPSLTWSPRHAVLSSSGDLAYTTGRYRYAAPGAEVAEGEYVTVWRRTDGAWRALFDMPNRPAAALGPGLRRVTLRSVRSAAGDLEATFGTWERQGQEPGRGAFLSVRRRTSAGDWQPVLDAAVAQR